MTEYEGNWNMAVHYMKRLDECMRAINASSAYGDLKLYKSSVDTLYIELHPKLWEHKDLLNEINKQRAKVEEVFGEWAEFKNTGRKNKQLEHQYSIDLVNELNRFNILLRDAVHVCKLLLPENLDPRSIIFENL